MSLRCAVILAIVLTSACGRSDGGPAALGPNSFGQERPVETGPTKRRALGGPRIEQAWAPATPPNATVAAAYMKILPQQADVLLGATTPAAAKVEMHISTEDGGMMKMRPLQTLELAADRSFAFEPGGAHFMLIGLHAPLAAGSRFPMSLRFRNAGEITVEVRVSAPPTNSASR